MTKLIVPDYISFSEIAEEYRHPETGRPLAAVWGDEAIEDLCRHLADQVEEWFKPQGQTEQRSESLDQQTKRMIRNQQKFIAATVALLKEIRDNPTPAKIDNILIDLQAVTLDQE